MTTNTVEKVVQSESEIYKPAFSIPAELSKAITQTCRHDDDESAFFVYDLDALERHLSQLQQQQVVKLWYTHVKLTWKPPKKYAALNTPPS